MKTRGLKFISLALTALCFSCSSKTFKGDDFENISVGSYQNGKLNKSEALENNGCGWIKIFRIRNRRFGNPKEISALKEILLSYSGKGCEKVVEVGDLSGEMGGKISPHLSHQNGLDVDIRYVAYGEASDPNADHWKSFFVKNGTLQNEFNRTENLKLIELFLKDERVKLVYVDQVIRHSLINGNPQVQHFEKLKTWPTHETHFHVRFHCPANEKKCVESEGAV